MSGPSLAHWAFINDPKKQAKIFAKKVGCYSPNTEKMVACFKTISAWRISNVLKATQDILHPRSDIFAPTIESRNDNVSEVFLEQHPLEILQKGKIINRVPTINGVNAVSLL